MSANGQAGDYPLMNYNFNYCGTWTFPAWQVCPTCNAWYKIGDYHQCLMPVQALTWTIIPAQSGWSCPKCSRVYGPTVTECAECNKAATKPDRTAEEIAALEKRLEDFSRAADALSEMAKKKDA